MFLKLHGVMSNEKILINTEFIEAVQEISPDSKTYKAYYEAGAKTVIRVRSRNQSSRSRTGSSLLLRR